MPNGPMIGPKNMAPFPLLMVFMGKPMGNSNRPTEARRRRWEHSQIWSRSLASHLSDAVRRVETFPPEFYWVEYVSSMNLCFFEWDVSSARCAELKITCWFFQLNWLRYVARLFLWICVGMIAVTDPIAWRYRPCKFWIETSWVSMLDLRILRDGSFRQSWASIFLKPQDLQQKLMKVYVRMQDVHMEAPQDVGEALSNPKRLAKCFAAAKRLRWWTGGKGCKED